MADFRVVISGGGIVGLAAAHCFASRDCPTLLLDKPNATSSIGEFGADLRSVALAPVAVSFLEKLVGKPIPSSFIDSMHIWERDGSAAITMAAAEVNEPHLASVYENNELTAALRAKLPSQVTVHESEGISAMHGETHSISVDGLGEVVPELLVIAEGSRSRTCKTLNLSYQLDVNLDQRAIATIVETPKSHQNRALQLFGPTPLAMLPLSNPCLRALIWSLPTDEAFNMLNASKTAFLDKLNRATEHLVGTISDVDRRLSFPLSHQLLDDFNPQPNVIVLGDAAHTIHPLAGQGVNLGLEDVRAAHANLQSMPTRLNKPGYWRSFNSKRKLRALAMLRLMSFFGNIYAVQSPYLRLLRNAGVRWVNENSPLKRQLIREAMGIGPIANVL